MDGKPRNYRQNSSNNTRGGRPQQRRSNNSGGGYRKNNTNRRSGGVVNVASATAAKNKYLERAREALINGDRVAAENFFQHADHFNRIIEESSENRRAEVKKTEAVVPAKPENTPIVSGKEIVTEPKKPSDREDV